MPESWEGLNPPYATIVADPPWQYDEGWPAASTSPRSMMNARGVPADAATRRTALPYSSMHLVQIMDLAVEELAADDAHLYLWTTNRYLRDAYDLAESWKFKPSQVLTWCKPPRGIGPGGAFSGTTEFVLFCRRGALPHRERVDSTWWEWPRSGHSAKPAAFLDIVERVSPGPYVELFARAPRLGWDHWGHGYESAAAHA